MSIFPKPFKNSPNRRQRKRLLETIKVTGVVRIIQGGKVVRERRKTTS